MSSASVADQVRAAAARNTELLGILHETDHASSGLEQQQRYLADMQNELKRVQVELAQLDRERKKELKDHEKYRDSVMKRFAYRVGGKTDKFEAKAEKEEKEYFELRTVLQKLQQQTNSKNNIETMIAEGEQVRSDLENGLRRHQQAQADLDGLYQRIFQGATPEFPEEDTLERAADTAGQAYHYANLQADSDKKVFDLLNSAWSNLGQARLHIENALSHSRMDMFGGGTMSDMMERNALSQAQNSIHSAEMLTSQAQRLSPHVQDLPRVAIDHGSLMSDVFFDNIFTDMAFHDKIKDSRAQLLRTVQACEQQLEAARARMSASQREMQMRWDTLISARSQLQKTREQIFEKVMNGQQGESGGQGQPTSPKSGKGSNNPFEQPPAYSS